MLAQGSLNRAVARPYSVDAIGAFGTPRWNRGCAVGNLARGGLSFRSTYRYEEGSGVEMAIPYTSRAPKYLCARSDRELTKGGGRGFHRVWSLLHLVTDLRKEKSASSVPTSASATPFGMACQCQTQEAPQASIWAGATSPQTRFEHGTVAA